MLIQHLQNPFDLILISILRTRNLFRMELHKPSSLPEIWTLAAHLEMQPVFHLVLLRKLVVSQGIRGVVSVD